MLCYCRKGRCELKNSEKDFNSFQNIIHLLGMAFKHYKIVFIFILLEMLSNGFLPLFGLYLPRLAVGLVNENRGLNHTMLVLGSFAAAYVSLQCINNVASKGKYQFQNQLRFLYRRLLFDKAQDCDYALMKTSEGQTWYEKAISSINTGNQSATTQMLNASARLVSGLISFTFIFVIISNLSLYIVLLLLILSVITYFSDVSAEQYEEKQWDEFGDLRKKEPTWNAQWLIFPQRKTFGFTI